MRLTTSGPAPWHRADWKKLYARQLARMIKAERLAIAFGINCRLK